LKEVLEEMEVREEMAMSRVEMVVQEVMEVLANGEVEEEEAVKEVLVGEEAVVAVVVVEGRVPEAAVKAKLDNQDLEAKMDQAWA
jgi:hypothetical protein